MCRRYGLLIASLSLLVLLGGCESKNIENEAKRKEKERLEQQQKQEEAEKQKKQEEEKRKKEEEERQKREEEERKKQEEEQKKAEEKRKADEKRRLKLQRIAGIYNGFLIREGERMNKTFELKVSENKETWSLSIVGYGAYNDLTLTTEEEDKLVFYKIFHYPYTPSETVTCYCTLSTKSVRITSTGGNGSPWEFEGTRQ